MSDEELISAYLDGQLSAAEHAMFEARLARDPELRRRVLVTRLIVDEARQLPMVAPPRNFILPADAGRRPVAARASLPLWVYRFGALAAALLCVVLVIVDFSPPAARPELAAPQALPAAPAAPPTLPEAPAQERAAPSDAEPRAFALPESAPPESAAAPDVAGSWIALPRALALPLLALAIVLGILGWGKRRR